MHFSSESVEKFELNQLKIVFIFWMKMPVWSGLLQQLKSKQQFKLDPFWLAHPEYFSGLYVTCHVKMSN